jgi:hypothetical protein
MTTGTAGTTGTTNGTNTGAGPFNTFREFYPYYLREHANPRCRLLHFVGSSLVLAVVFGALLTGTPLLLLAAPLAGYGFAWVGHYGFEKNRPATFTYPLWSLMGDWVMYRDILQGKLSIYSDPRRLRDGRGPRPPSGSKTASAKAPVEPDLADDED